MDVTIVGRGAVRGGGAVTGPCPRFRSCRLASEMTVTIAEERASYQHLQSNCFSSGVRRRAVRRWQLRYSVDGTAEHDAGPDCSSAFLLPAGALLFEYNFKSRIRFWNSSVYLPSTILPTSLRALNPSKVLDSRHYCCTALKMTKLVIRFCLADTLPCRCSDSTRPM
jgi:hypothetical protein